MVWSFGERMFINPSTGRRDPRVVVEDSRCLAWSAVALVLTVAAAPAQGQTPLGFTEAQAEAGSAVYVERCASCHGDSSTSSSRVTTHGCGPTSKVATWCSMLHPT